MPLGSLAMSGHSLRGNALAWFPVAGANRRNPVFSRKSECDSPWRSRVSWSEVWPYQFPLLGRSVDSEVLLLTIEGSSVPAIPFCRPGESRPSPCQCVCLPRGLILFFIFLGFCHFSRLFSKILFIGAPRMSFPSRVLIGISSPEMSVVSLPTISLSLSPKAFPGFVVRILGLNSGVFSIGFLGDWVESIDPREIQALRYW